MQGVGDEDHERIIVEKPGLVDLGRNVELNPQSRAFSVGTQPSKPSTTGVTARRSTRENQRSCTGNATAEVLMPEPLWVPGRNLIEDDAVALYKAATRLDNIPAKTRPQTRSVLDRARWKVVVKAKYIVGYAHELQPRATLARSVG